MNQVVLVVELVESRPVRYTPAGVPVLEWELAHDSEVIEGGVPRRVAFDVTALVLGPQALRLASMPLGTRLEVTGFLAPTRKGSTRLRLHVQQAHPQH